MQQKCRHLARKFNSGLRLRLDWLDYQINLRVGFVTKAAGQVKKETPRRTVGRHGWRGGGKWKAMVG